MFVILSFSSSLLSVRDRSDVFLLRLPCVILIIGLSSNSLVLVDSVLLTLLGLRNFLLVSLVLIVLTVVEVVVLPLSLYLGLGAEFAETSSVFALEVGGVYLLDPLLRDLLGSLFLNVEVSARGASTSSSSTTRLTGLVLDRTRPRNGLDGRVEFRDAILTLDLLDGGVLVVVVVVASEELNLRLAKPNGRGCETAAIVDLLADAIVVLVVVVVDEVVAGRVVNKISVADSSTSFAESGVESVVSTLGLTLDGFFDGSRLITVKISVEVEVVVVGAVDVEVVVLAVVLLACISESSSSFVGEVVISNEDRLDKFSNGFEVPLNLCTLLYLKDFGNNVNYIAINVSMKRNVVYRNLESIVGEPSFLSVVARSTPVKSPPFSEFLKLIIIKR